MMLVSALDYLFGWVFRLAFQVAEGLLLWAVPIMKTKKILANDEDRDTLMKNYMCYWIIVALVLSLEYVSFGLVQCLPCYKALRLGFLVWVQLDHCAKSVEIVNVMTPIVNEYSEKIDEVLDNVDANVRKHGKVAGDLASSFVGEVLEKSGPKVIQTAMKYAGAAGITAAAVSDDSKDPSPKSS